MIKNLSYDQVYEVIAKYDYKLLPYFADGWSRFPDSNAARYIIDKLSEYSDFYNRPEYLDKFNEIESAINQIKQSARV